MHREKRQQLLRPLQASCERALASAGALSLHKKRAPLVQEPAASLACDSVPRVPPISRLRDSKLSVRQRRSNLRFCTPLFADILLSYDRQSVPPKASLGAS